MDRRKKDEEASALLRRVADGDEGAFKELYEMLHRRIYFYLFRLLRTRETAEDVMVETFARVWRSAGRFRGESRVSTWIMGIARNLAMNEIRKRHDCEDIDDHPYVQGTGMPDPEGTERRQVLKDAVSRLSPAHGEVIELVFFHEMSYSEVAEITGIPVNTVKTRVFYAKEAMKKILSERGISKDDL